MGIGRVAVIREDVVAVPRQQPTGLHSRRVTGNAQQDLRRGQRDQDAQHDGRNAPPRRRPPAAASFRVLAHARHCDAEGPASGNLSAMSGDPIEARVLAHLDELGVPYERVECDPALADTAAFCAHYGYPLEISANAIVVASKKEPRAFAACLALATTRLDVNRAVKNELGAGRLSFASAEDMRELTGMEVGGVTPFALPDDLPLLIDGAVMAPDRVIVGTGGRTSKVLVAPSALLTHPLARVVDGLAKPRGD